MLSPHCKTWWREEPLTQISVGPAFRVTARQRTPHTQQLPALPSSSHALSASEGWPGEAGVSAQDLVSLKWRRWPNCNPIWSLVASWRLIQVIFRARLLAVVGLKPSVTFLLAVIWGVLSATRGCLQAKPGVPFTRWQQGLQGRRMPLRVAAVESHRSQGSEGSKAPVKCSLIGGEIAPWCPRTSATLRGGEYPGRVHREFCRHQDQRPHPQREKLWQTTQTEAGGSTEGALFMGSAVLCWGLNPANKGIVFMVNTGCQRGEEPKSSRGCLQVRWSEEITHLKKKKKGSKVHIIERY